MSEGYQPQENNFFENNNNGSSNEESPSFLKDKEKDFLRNKNSTYANDSK